MSEEKETSARGRLVGSARAVHHRPRLRVSFVLLVWFDCGCLVTCLWETLIFGTGDWLLFWGLSFVACLPQLFQLPGHNFPVRLFPTTTSAMTSTRRSTRSVAGEGAGLRLRGFRGELGGRMGDAPYRDTPRWRSRFVDDSDDRLFRQVTDDERSQRARSDRGGSAVASGQAEDDFIFAMNVGRASEVSRNLFSLGHQDLSSPVSTELRSSRRTSTEDMSGRLKSRILERLMRRNPNPSLDRQA